MWLEHVFAHRIREIGIRILQILPTHINTDGLRDTLVAKQREDMSFVWESVRKLPVGYREVIHLFYYEGYSTAQIGTILKMKEATVRSSLSRGRGKLREILEEVYEFEKMI